MSLVPVSGESESISAAPSISAAAIHCTQNFRGAGGAKFFSDLCDLLWPDKAAFELAQRTGASLRMCRYWLAGSHAPNGRAIGAVLAELLLRLK